MFRYLQFSNIIGALLLLATILLLNMPYSVLNIPSPDLETPSPALKSRPFSAEPWLVDPKYLHQDVWRHKLIGQKIFEGLNFGDRVPTKLSDSVEFPKKTRFIWPDSAVTCDWVETRLNVELDSRGVVTEVHYG